MFLEQPWHDSVLEKIVINRSNPGYKDEIELVITWPDGTRSLVLFQDVYFASLNLNFGVIAEESIMNALMLQETDKEFEALRVKWERLIEDFDDIKGYVIETASTGSLIKIFAKICKIDGV